MTYNLGLYIDISCIGFAGVDIEKQKILFSGVHVFDVAESPRTGDSLATARRNKRRKRRSNRRKSQRKKAIRRLLADHGLENLDGIDLSRNHPKTGRDSPPVTPWDLRMEALERRLTDKEFARILFHIAKHRGYQSNGKDTEADDVEGGKVLARAKELQEFMEEAGVCTIGAYLAKFPKKRNSYGSYECSVTRDMLREEVKEIFEKQQIFGNEKATPELFKAFAGDGDPNKRNTIERDGIAFYQRPLQFIEHHKKVFSEEVLEKSDYGVRWKENISLRKISRFEDIRNPVVNHSFAQARRIINACIRKYGMPKNMNIELAQNVGKPFKERNRIEREQHKVKVYRDDMKECVADITGKSPDQVSEDDTLKYYLWNNEQEKVCLYCGSQITDEQFASQDDAVIDYIIPYSRSWYDSYTNKTVCHVECYQEKGEKTPYEWLSGTEHWDGLVERSKKLPRKKLKHIQIIKFDEIKAEEWKNRALNDGRTFAKLFKNHLDKSLTLNGEEQVKMRNSFMRKHLLEIWGMTDKKYHGTDRRYAQDAILVACSTHRMLHKISHYNKHELRSDKKAKIISSLTPWETYFADVEESIDNVFVSRLPVRKVTGTAHGETIRSIRKLHDGTRKVIQRVKLSDLNKEKLENIVDKERNIKLYNILKGRLEEHDGESKKAFSMPIFMPTNDSSKQGPRINSVRVFTNEKSGVEINSGLAGNGDMVRVDVFQRNGKYFLVPVYVHHFSAKKLPNHAIVADKAEENWEEMMEDEFLFSLYKNDVVGIKSKKDNLIAYYIGTDRSKGRINLWAHDSDPDFGQDGLIRTSVKNLLSLEKYNVDYFGNLYKVRKEKRIGLRNRPADE